MRFPHDHITPASPKPNSHTHLYGCMLYVGAYTQCEHIAMDMHANTAVCIYVQVPRAGTQPSHVLLPPPLSRPCSWSCLKPPIPSVVLYGPIKLLVSLLVPSRFFNSLDAEPAAGRGQSKVMNNFPLTSGKNLQSELQAEDRNSEEPGSGAVAEPSRHKLGVAVPTGNAAVPALQGIRG